MNIFYLFNILIFLTNLISIHKFLHIYQLKDYNLLRYFKYFLKKKILFILFCLLLFVFEIFINNKFILLPINSIVYIINLFHLKNLIKSSKTPLKFTKKMSRLLVISILFLFLLSFYEKAFLLLITAPTITPPLADFLNIYDKIKNKYYISKASKKIHNHPTKIIAITGSCGKTSVKNILSEMLSTQYKVQATPASFNTPLGIAKFINNELRHETEFLILEYGARRRKDIKKLCNLFGADYGIITTISQQHLESFKSIENVFYAKKELSNFLQNKPCVFNMDNIYIRRMFTEKTGNKISVSTNQQAFIYANNIDVINGKTHFNLHLNTQTYHLQTNLLGRHNILNICLSSSLATILDITDENIISTISNLKQVEHRLSLFKTHINILDDSYNCSPASALESLWVLKRFNGKKMIVTPGIIECGKQKHLINSNLGKLLAKFDYIVIVGNENKTSILEGIKNEIQSKGFQPKIMFADSLDESKHHFSYLNNGDTLLLLNDLPDDYT